MQTGMDQVSRAAASLRDAPARADRRNSQERLQRQIELVQQQGANLLALARQSGLDGVELAQAQEPIVQAQADGIARRSNANADEELGRTIRLKAKYAELAQAAQTNAGQVTEGILNTKTANTIDIENNRLGHAWKVADRGLAHNDATNRMLFGSQGDLSALEQVIKHDEASQRMYYENARALGPTKLERYAGTLIPALATAGLLLG
jgi:hypothetical protein